MFQYAVLILRMKVCKCRNINTSIFFERRVILFISLLHIVSRLKCHKFRGPKICSDGRISIVFEINSNYNLPYQGFGSQGISVQSGLHSLRSQTKPSLSMTESAAISSRPRAYKGSSQRCIKV